MGNDIYQNLEILCFAIVLFYILVSQWKPYWIMLLCIVKIYNHPVSVMRLYQHLQIDSERDLSLQRLVFIVSYRILLVSGSGAISTFLFQVPRAFWVIYVCKASVSVRKVCEMVQKLSETVWVAGVLKSEQLYYRVLTPCWARFQIYRVSLGGDIFAGRVKLDGGGLLQNCLLVIMAGFTQQNVQRTFTVRKTCVKRTL